jgi:hypothetical protein
MTKKGVEKMNLEEVKKSDVKFLFGGTKCKAQWDWLIEQAEKVERLEEYIGQLEHEKQLLYGRLNMVRDLIDEKI